MTPSPQRYRKIPVEVDAIQWTGDNKDAIEAFTHGKARLKIVPGPGRGVHEALVIHTLEGDMRAALGDWIIRGVESEVYPCKDSVFRKTYEPLDEQPTGDSLDALSPNAQAFARGGVVIEAPAPSIGRIVHYQSYGTPGGEHLPEPQAAIITKVHQVPPSSEGAVTARDVVDLFVIYPNGTSHKAGVLHSYDDAPTPGMWNWPRLV